MNIDMNVFDSTEKIVFSLRALYNSYGYKKYRMSKFEEYDLYSRNKDFLVSDSVITFTDTSGKLLALKPDVTLSIIKNIKEDIKGTEKLYYNENVYRVSDSTGSFKEIMQTGLECIGEIDIDCIGEALSLAAKSLSAVSERYVLEVCDLDILSAIIKNITDEKAKQAAILKCVSEKNLHGIDELCKDGGIETEKTEPLKKLLSVYGKAEVVFDKLSKVSFDIDIAEKLAEFKRVIEISGVKDKITVDFSSVADINYYNGIIFKGFIDSVAASVLSGGQYDNLMRKLGRKNRAIGFAVYLDRLERVEEEGSDAEPMLNIALPKGRLGEKVYEKFAKAGFPCPELLDKSRKLIFENREAGVRYFWVKPSDVAIYVERGAADIGVAGRDILLEYEPEVYELLDLDIGKCRMAVAAPRDFEDDGEHTLRVATKFSKIAQKYYSSIGRDIDIVHLNGSIEIAPILKLTDVIVDIVETGSTLKENNLEVKEEIVNISARLIANKASFKFKTKQIEKIVKSF